MIRSNDRLVIAATACYSILFYQQNAGINFLLFNLVFMGILLFKDKKRLYQKNWILAALMCGISATSIVFHSSALAIIANMTSLLLLSAFSFNSSTSYIFSFLFSCYSVSTSLVFVIVDAAKRTEHTEEKDQGTKSSYRYFMIFVVLLLCILFFVIYRQSNPLFAENTNWINFNFISFSWVIFTAMGFFIVYGLFYHKTILQVEEWEQALPSHAEKGNIEKEPNYKTELSAGILLFVFLNFMLLVLNVGDINTIWFKGVLPKGINHSDFVHNGVSLIILSIVIATGLIMFLFRHNFLSFKNSGILKWLVYLWVLQNLVMLFSTACRNQLYIHDYNLTYKRVGVYVWLFLAAVGLLIAALKIYNDRSNWFLIRSNFFVWFCFLSLSSTLNWDILITRYNLNNKPLTDIDFYYLFSLSDSNIPELLSVSKDKDFSLITSHLKNYTNSSSYSFNAKTYKSLMGEKVGHFLKDYKNDWQSWDLRDQRIMENLIKK